MKNIRQVVKGQYVATPIKNAFNNKTSYWLSKEGCTIAMYMFTVEGQGMSEKDFEWRLSDEGIAQEIPRFEELCKRPFSQEEYLKCKETLEGSVKKYNVSIAVDGRVNVAVNAASFEEAKEKALADFCDVNIGDVECIGFSAVNAETENEEFHDY